MTASEYKDYTNKVRYFLEHNNIHSLMVDRIDFNEFSIVQCECCKSQLAGARYDALGYEVINDKLSYIDKYLICTDCMYYNDYGQLDDLTMLSIKESEL